MVKLPRATSWWVREVSKGQYATGIRLLVVENNLGVRRRRNIQRDRNVQLSDPSHGCEFELVV